MRFVPRRLILPAAGLLAAVSIAACNQIQAPEQAAPARSAEDQAKAQVERGRLLIAGGGVLQSGC